MERLSVILFYRCKGLLLFLQRYLLLFERTLLPPQGIVEVIETECPQRHGDNFKPQTDGLDVLYLFLLQPRPKLDCCEGDANENERS